MKICPPYLWVNIDGAPRSGTTALLKALNRSQEIFIFHEFTEFDLSRAIEPVHAMAARLRRFPHTDGQKENLITDEDTDALFLAFMAYAASSKFPRIIGTKDPEAVLHPHIPLMARAARKTIHITRFPISIFASAMKRVADSRRGDDQFGMDEKVSLLRNAALQIRNWNNACQSIQSTSFLHLFYEDICENPQQAAQQINSFLGTADICLDEWVTPKPLPDAQDFLNISTEFLGPDAAFLVHSQLIFDWNERHERMRNRQLMTPPILLNTAISFTLDGFGWAYILSGFTSPTNEGTGINCDHAWLLFAAPSDAVEPEIELGFSRIQAPLPNISIILTVTLFGGSDLDSGAQSAQFTFELGAPPPRVTMKSRPLKVGNSGPYYPVKLRMRFRAVTANGEELHLPENYTWASLNTLTVRTE